MWPSVPEQPASAAAFGPDVQSSQGRGSTERDDAERAAVRSGGPGVVHAGHHDTIARRQRVDAIVESQLHGARQDDVKVDRVSVVHWEHGTRLVLDDDPVGQSRSHPKIEHVAVPRGARRWRTLVGVEHRVDPDARHNTAEGDLPLLHDARTPRGVDAGHKSSHDREDSSTRPGEWCRGGEPDERLGSLAIALENEIIVIATTPS